MSRCALSFGMVCCSMLPRISNITNMDKLGEVKKSFEGKDGVVVVGDRTSGLLFILAFFLNSSYRWCSSKLKTHKLCESVTYMGRGLHIV